MGEAIFGPGVPEHLPVILTVLVLTGGAAVWIVTQALRLRGWLVEEFKDLRGEIGDRFARHEETEREWQQDVTTQLRDVSDRLARVEGQLVASANERHRRRAEDDRHAERLEE